MTYEELIVARYNQIQSLRPGDYSRVTRNASYYVGLLRAAEGAAEPPGEAHRAGRVAGTGAD